MAKDLFSIAAQEYKEPAYETKQRKIILPAIFFFSIGAAIYGLYTLKDFPFNLPLNEALSYRENQFIAIESVFAFLMSFTALVFLSILLRKPSIWSFVGFFILFILDSGLVVFSDLLGFQLVWRRGIGAAYFGCIALPLLVIFLIINQKRKNR